MCKQPSFFEFPLGHSIAVGFAELIFTSLIRMSTLNPKSRHYVTLAMPSWLGERKRLYEEKLSLLPGLPAGARYTK